MSDESSDHEALLEKRRSGKFLSSDEARKSTKNLLEPKRKQCGVVDALIDGENSGVSNRSPEEIRAAVKRDLSDQ